jgi:DNA-binding GntR family transcriptional regulator
MVDLTVTVTPSSPVPLYHQISDQLEAAIGEGRLEKGAFLPNEIELAERWGVSRPTVRRGIQELVSRGMLVRRRGVGTQVVADQIRRTVKLSSFYDDLNAAGRRPATKVLRCETEPASGEVARELEILVGAPVLALERVRSANGVALALMHNWLAVPGASEIAAEDLELTGLYELLRRRGIRPHIARQVIGARAASNQEAEILRLAPGSPLLTMRRVMQDRSGANLELGFHAYDATQYSVEMTVVGGP